MSARSSGSPPTKRRRMPEEPEEHQEGNERWLVTYADMVTLLMVLFIVMFAMSNVDETKYAALKEGLADGFGHASSILNGATSTSSVKGTEDPGSDSYEMLVASLPEKERQQVSQILQESDRLRNGRTAAAAKIEAERLLAIWQQVSAALAQAGLSDDVQAQVDERGLVVSLVSRHVVFEPNVAVLTRRGERVVDAIAPILADLKEPIELDGHTNQEKVKPKYYPTDWELSLARAAHVLRRLEEVHHLPAKRLRATGFGHTRPLLDPKIPGSQAINKRVDLVVLSSAAPETRELLAPAYAELLASAGTPQEEPS